MNFRLLGLFAFMLAFVHAVKKKAPQSEIRCLNQSMNWL